MVEHPAVIKCSFPPKGGLKNRVNSEKPKSLVRTKDMVTLSQVLREIEGKVQRLFRKEVLFRLYRDGKRPIPNTDVLSVMEMR